MLAEVRLRVDYRGEHSLPVNVRKDARYVVRANIGKVVVGCMIER